MMFRMKQFDISVNIIIGLTGRLLSLRNVLLAFLVGWGGLYWTSYQITTDNVTNS